MCVGWSIKSGVRWSVRLDTKWSVKSVARWCVATIFVLFASIDAVAQSYEEPYYPYAEYEHPLDMLEVDSTLFFRALHTKYDRYSESTQFRQPYIATSYRGQGRFMAKASFEGLILPYRYHSTLRLLNVEERYFSGTTPSKERIGIYGGERQFALSTYEPHHSTYAAVRFTTLNYLLGAKYKTEHEINNRWHLMAGVDARLGSDAVVEGVFTNGINGALHLQRTGERGSTLNLTLLAPISMKGTRLSSTEEAFTLTNNLDYNPAWGVQSGEVRNSRIRREAIPTIIAAYSLDLGESSRLHVAASGEVGLSKYSGLNWYDALTPMPDNYRYMPSYTHSIESRLAWQMNDLSYTQIDWDELIRQNRMSDDGAIYTLEDRVEQVVNLQAVAKIHTTLSESLDIYYGINASSSSTRYYKQMRDLLEGEYIIDIDHFLVDDATYSNSLQNNLRNPNRRIAEGDRFGYDYSLYTKELNASIFAEYHFEQLRISAEAQVGYATLSRYGHYEKELFSGARSYGASQSVELNPYLLRANLGWALTPRRHISLSVMTAASLPNVEELFYQPQYNNAVIENPTLERHFGFEATYRHITDAADLSITAFLSTISGRIESYSYFDDLSSLYANMNVYGISTVGFGLEAAANITLSYRWRLSATATLGSYRYSDDAGVTILSDRDNSPIDYRATARMADLHTGDAPQYGATAQISHYAGGGWGGSMSVGYLGGRYIAAQAMRRTDRVSSQAGVTPETFSALVSQERLADAVTMDASIFKSLYFDSSTLTFSVMLRNILGLRTPYSGYESVRIHSLPTGDIPNYSPHATRYTYTSSRSIYLSVSYKF